MKRSLTFIDLFAGIGGMRLGFEKADFRCLLTCERDSDALETYMQNFPEETRHPEHKISKDIFDLNIKAKDFDKVPPKYDVLVAGFPCQPFSIAGLRKGLKDERGKVFDEIIKILGRKKNKPRAFLLENVKGMLNHDGGDTYAKYMKPMLEGAGYIVFEKVLNSMIHADIPQNRERLFIIGLNKNEFVIKKTKVKNAVLGKSTVTSISRIGRKKFPKKEFSESELFPPVIDGRIKKIGDYIQQGRIDDKYYYTERYKECYKKLKAEMKNMHSDTLYQYRRHYVRANRSNVCPTLTANMGSGGHNVPLYFDGKRIRKLTPKECGMFQGFQHDFQRPQGMSDTKLYHQFGNSVTVELIKRIAIKIRDILT